MSGGISVPFGWQHRELPAKRQCVEQDGHTFGVAPLERDPNLDEDILALTFTLPDREHVKIRFTSFSHVNLLVQLVRFNIGTAVDYDSDSILLEALGVIDIGNTF